MLRPLDHVKDAGPMLRTPELDVKNAAQMLRTPAKC